VCQRQGARDVTGAVCAVRARQVLALEKRFLDPRRPTKPTKTDREEGLVPYHPSLPIIPHHIITTNHQVRGLGVRLARRRTMCASGPQASLLSFETIKISTTPHPPVNCRWRDCAGS